MEHKCEKPELSETKPLAFYPGLTISPPTDIIINLAGYPNVVFVYSISENKRYRNLLAEKGADQYKIIE